LPIEVHVAVTSRCSVGCEGCYLDATPHGTDPPARDLETTFDALASAGVFTVAFGGGEPTLRDDLNALAVAARARGLTPVVTTSGIGLNPDKIEKLRAFAHVNVSYDGAGPSYASVRGFDASRHAEAAITQLHNAGIAVGVNIVLTRDTFDALPATVERAVSLGATQVQLLRYKPQGRAKSITYMQKRLSSSQSSALPSVLRRLSRDYYPRAHVRIDCALVPFLSSDSEIYRNPTLLERWGIFGCEAGAHLGATRADGTLAPCSFASATDDAVAARDIAMHWPTSASIGAYRNFAHQAPEPCASCNIRRICKGGCKVVSEALTGIIAADPECPRVIAGRASTLTEQAPQP